MDSHPDFEETIRAAADILVSGGVVAYPTESFYGLAVDPANTKAIRRLYLIKKRESESPILLIIASLKQLEGLVGSLPPIAQKLTDAFWPGGLTLVFEANPMVSPLLTAGKGKIGIRLSSHPVATSLARALGRPITGTSANTSGSPACRNAKEVLKSLGGAVDLILDGGETPGGLGSTILDVTVDPPRVLREGMISREQLESFLTPSSVS
jgi:L-threonylcarbamoyladenylate synthase